MNSIRVRFSRGEEVKYISHLDLMKSFERAIRRAKLPIAYSQGFNPHPQMVFGLPLSVGVTSEAEYADFELAEDMEPQQFMEALNRQLPPGLEILEACNRVNKSNIMAIVTGAAYIVLACPAEGLPAREIELKLGEFLDRKEILVDKETKSGTKTVDIRPMIKALQLYYTGLESILKAPASSVNPVIRNYARILQQNPAYNTRCSGDSMLCFDMRLSAGSKANLKPELLLSAIGDFLGTDFQVIKVHRTGLFTGAESSSNPVSDAQKV